MARWKLRDVIVMVVLAIVCGGIYYLSDFLYDVISGAWVPLQGLINGLWMIASVLVAYVIRRPGAALLAEMVGASVELLLGSQWGFSNLTSGLVQGVGAELAFFIFFYRRYNLPVCLLSGFLASLGCAFQWFWQSGGDKLSATVIVGYFVATLLSGVVLAGWLPKLVGDALNRAGVVRNFAIGQQTRTLNR
ncbi:ECF transporter S component [Alicyclobacillus fodiniaquatilis]|uniref:ECF transporter S component n=1 Tax=Alicyclobacillus fodiniaquatilis TaxID=1661150 RepID=A0ABW4JBR2_9BACL